MEQHKAIKRKLDTIYNSSEMDSENKKVTISKDDFNWLIYGIDELLLEIEKVKESTYFENKSLCSLKQ